MKLILKILDYYFLISSIYLSMCLGIFTLMLFPALLTQSFILNILVIYLFIVLFFTPAILIIVIFFVAKKYNGKNSKLLKILSYFIISALIFFHPVISACFVICADRLDEKNEPYNPIRPISEYNKFVENKTSETSHFPDVIPPNATNVELYRNYLFHGDVEEYLKFKIDDEYINNELKNYQYTTIIAGDKYTGHPPRGRERDKDDIYYILGDSLEVHRGYSYGIVVNRKTHEIIYYYSSY